MVAVSRFSKLLSFVGFSCRAPFSSLPQDVCKVEGLAMAGAAGRTPSPSSLIFIRSHP